MISRKSPLEIIALLENNPARITVQRITVVINRRRNTCALEGVWAAAAASDMRAEGSKHGGKCQHRLLYCSADWQSAVSRIGNPPGSRQSCATPTASRRHGRLPTCATER